MYERAQIFLPAAVHSPFLLAIGVAVSVIFMAAAWSELRRLPPDPATLNIYLALSAIGIAIIALYDIGALLDNLTLNLALTR